VVKRKGKHLQSPTKKVKWADVEEEEEKHDSMIE
jgi:hypothetical protein